MKVIAQVIVMILQGIGIAIVAGLIGKIIQSMTDMDDFQRGVFSGFLATYVFYLFVLTGKQKSQ